LKIGPYSLDPGGLNFNNLYGSSLAISSYNGYPYLVVGAPSQNGDTGVVYGWQRIARIFSSLSFRRISFYINIFLILQKTTGS
jgi:hypothetical protein